MEQRIAQLTKDLNVLLVEDDALALTIMEELLEEGFHNVLTAENGEAGLELFLNSRIPIDLVITDIVMPQMNGLEMIERMRSEAPGLHVIITSAHNDAVNLLKAIELGVEYFALKPIGMSGFFQVLEKAARRIKDEKALDALRLSESAGLIDEAADLSLETVMGTAAIPLCVIDGEDRLVSANEPFKELLGDAHLPRVLSTLFLHEEGYLFSDDMFDWKTQLAELQEVERLKAKIRIDGEERIFYVTIRPLALKKYDGYFVVGLNELCPAEGVS